MLKLIKPSKLNIGDKIATISPSWGIAGEEKAVWRYKLAVNRLKDYFGFECIAAPNSMRGEKYLKENAEARAEDILWAFENPNIKGIIANIGGNDSIRLFPYIDYQAIKNNPKVLIGYSDIMNIHLMCYKAGLSTFYGANLLTSFGEPQGVHPYIIEHFKKMLFQSKPIGVINSPDKYCCDVHDYENQKSLNNFHSCDKYQLLQGHGVVRGKLLGGHTGIIELEQTSLLAPFFENKNIILFLEDIVKCVSPTDFADFFKWLSNMAILQNIKGILIGRFNEFPENVAYKDILIKTMNQLGASDLPILYNLPFGHTLPTCVLPYDALVEIDCENVSFSILESGVV